MAASYDGAAQRQSVIIAGDLQAGYYFSDAFEMVIGGNSRT